MSRRYETKVTITLDDEERDVTARARVEVGPGLSHGGWGAEIDGQVELLIGDVWTEMEDVPLETRDIERIDEALCDAALEDDSSECVERAAE